MTGTAQYDGAGCQLDGEIVSAEPMPLYTRRARGLIRNIGADHRPIMWSRRPCVYGPRALY